jgi:hypothetical protein
MDVPISRKLRLEVESVLCLCCSNKYVNCWEPADKQIWNLHEIYNATLFG